MVTGEVSQLAKIKRHVRDLQLCTAAKERIEQSAGCEVRTRLINTAKSRPHYYYVWKAQNCKICHVLRDDQRSTKRSVGLLKTKAKGVCGINLSGTRFVRSADKFL